MPKATPKKTKPSSDTMEARFRAAEFHHRALSEPDVSLSAHPAPSILLA
jgi:hypothetical protein